MDSSLILSQFTASALIVWVIEQLKRAGWCRWIRADTDVLNRIIAWLAAGAAAAGIHFTFDSDAGVLTIGGLTLANVAHSLWQWLTSGAMQETLYRMAYKSAPKA